MSNLLPRMRAFTESREIAAPPNTAWKYISDVADWPKWLPTVSRVEPLAGGALAVGARFKVSQPKLRPLVWSVTELNPGRNFVWQSSGPGLALLANHTITAGPDGRSKVILEFRFSGLLAPFVARLFGPVTQRYLAAEASALKELAEADVQRGAS